MLDVLPPAGIKIVDAKHLVAVGKKPLAEMRADESRTSGNKRSYSGKIHLALAIFTRDSKGADYADSVNLRGNRIKQVSGPICEGAGDLVNSLRNVIRIDARCSSKNGLAERLDLVVRATGKMHVEQIELRRPSQTCYLGGRRTNFNCRRLRDELRLVSDEVLLGVAVLFYHVLRWSDF